MDWIAANLNGLAPILVLIGTGLGVLMHRHITGQAHVEDQESLERTIRLKKLMEAEGMSLRDVEELRENFRRGSGGLLNAEAEALVQKRMEAEDAAFEPYDDEVEYPDGPIAFEDTNFGMRVKAGAELDALNGQIRLAVMRLEHGLSEARSEQLTTAQEAWEKYCHADADYAALLFEGGTGASLLRSGRMIQLSEQRLRDLALYEAEKNL